jgi:hypothetical protein
MIKREDRCSGGGYWRYDISVNDVIRRLVLCNGCGRYVGIRWARYENGRYRVLVQHHKAKKLTESSPAPHRTTPTAKDR